ncbi:MAG: pectate lyase [Armatimonadota bacterium]|nr:pectate lyase [Armatimonadota bacterium]
MKLLTLAAIVLVGDSMHSQTTDTPALAGEALVAAVDALAARDMPDGVADIDRMTEANLYETERPPVYAAIFASTYDATGEERFLHRFLAVADLCVAMKQPEGGYSRVAFRKRVDAQETQTGRMTFRNSRSFKAQRVVLQAFDYTGDQRYLRSALETAQFTLSAQHPDGAWHSDYPAPPRSYLELPMLNDRVTISSVRELMLVYEHSADPRYLQAIRRTGQWLIDHQLHEPTPGWAQHYDFDDRPAWGRRFEPPCACSAPSIEVIDVLIDIHLLTGDARYLQPIPAAVAWLNRARTGPNEWARFYEVKTGRPLYAATEHEPWLRYERDDELYGGYAQWGSWPFETRRARWQRLQEIGRLALIAEEAAPMSADEARQVVEAEEEYVREVSAPDGFLGAWPQQQGKVPHLVGHVQRVARYLRAVQRVQAAGGG